MKTAQIEAFFATLQAANPHPVTELEYTNVFELLAAVLLSAQATDVSVNKASRALFAAAPTPQKMLALGLPAVLAARGWVTLNAHAADLDALVIYLRSLPPVAQPNRPHALRFPYDTQWALALWRALYFRPGRFEAQPAQSEAWNRGAYLVQGLGHCNACHAARNLLGANAGVEDLSGGQIPMQGWYAPSLRDPAQAGVAGWETAQVVQLLQTGVSPRGSALGPMAEVVLHSTQHLTPPDLAAMAGYLQTLPAAAPRAATEGARRGTSATGAWPARACGGRPCTLAMGSRVATRAASASPASFYALALRPRWR